MKILIIILLIILSFAAGAQVFTPQTAAGYQDKRHKTDSTDYIPTFCGVPNLRSTVAQKMGAIAFDSCNHRFYYYDPKTNVWDTIHAGGGGTGGGITQSQLNDTAFAIRNDMPTVTDQFYDSTSLNWNGTKYVYYNGVIPVDSVPINASPNFANTNLMATGNRFHNFNNYRLSIGNAKDISLSSSIGSNLVLNNLGAAIYSNGIYNYISSVTARDSVVSISSQSASNFIHNLIFTPTYVKILRDLNPAAPVKFIFHTDGAAADPGNVAYFQNDTLKRGNLDLSNGNTAFSWGNHALAGYLTSFTETDPIWTAASGNYRTFSQNNLLYAPLSHLHSTSDLISGILPIVRGGTGLGTIGTVGQSLRVATGGTVLEYFTPAAAIDTTPLHNQIVSNTSALAGKQNTITTGTTAQYFRGDLSLATFPTIPPQYQTPGQLTDGATITWNLALTTNDSVTLAGNRTLAITNPVAGMFGVLVVKQDATGSRTLALPANSKVIGGGTGTITLTTTAGAKDILTFYYDGSFYYFNYGKNYN